MPLMCGLLFSLCVSVHTLNCDRVLLYITHDLISAGGLFLAPPLFINRPAERFIPVSGVCVCVFAVGETENCNNTFLSDFR